MQPFLKERGFGQGYSESQLNSLLREREGGRDQRDLEI